MGHGRARGRREGVPWKEYELGSRNPDVLSLLCSAPSWLCDLERNTHPPPQAFPPLQGKTSKGEGTKIQTALLGPGSNACPGDSAGLLHTRALLNAERSSPGGHAGSAFPPHPWAAGRGEGGPGCQRPQRPQIGKLAGSPASCLASACRGAHRRHAAARQVWTVQGNPAPLLNQ